jgi:hypothetical protein
VIDRLADVVAVAANVDEYPPPGDRVLGPLVDPEGGVARDDEVVGGGVVETVLGVAAVAQPVDVASGLGPESVEVLVAVIAMAGNDVVLRCAP